MPGRIIHKTGHLIGKSVNKLGHFVGHSLYEVGHVVGKTIGGMFSSLAKATGLSKMVWIIIFAALGLALLKMKSHNSSNSQISSLNKVGYS
jgi:uncharacterized membrane protein YadS